MSTGTSSDAEFLAAVEAATYPGEKFGHRAHLRLAWLYLRAHGYEEGLSRIRATLRRYATALGAPTKFHETMTRAWAERVQAGLDLTPDLGVFEAFLAAHPELLDPALLGRHYGKETLDSAAARAGWVPPDREPFPARRLAIGRGRGPG